MLTDSKLRAKLLEDLGIFNLIDRLSKGAELHRNSIPVVNFYHDCLTNVDIATRLGLYVRKPTPSGSERMMLLNNCLFSIGVYLKPNKTEVINCTRERIYVLDSIIEF